MKYINTYAWCVWLACSLSALGCRWYELNFYMIFVPTVILVQIAKKQYCKELIEDIRKEQQ